MKSHRLFSLIISFITALSFGSCSMPASDSSTSPSAQTEVEKTSAEETEQLVIEDRGKCTDNAIRLFWNEIEGADKYEVESQSKYGWDWICSFDEYSEKGFRIERLKPDTQYTFRVTAKFGWLSKKEDVSSEPITVKTKPKAPTTTKKPTTNNNWNDDYDNNYTTTTKKTYTPPATTQQQKMHVILNTSTYVYHIGPCPAAGQINSENRLEYDVYSLSEIPDIGSYSSCGRCAGHKNQ